MRKIFVLLCVLVMAAACGAVAETRDEFSIVSIGPASTEIIAALGFGGDIVAADEFSGNVPGIPDGVAVLDMMALDLEFIISKQPDVVFSIDMGDPFSVLTDAGIRVVLLPTSVSIAAVRDDIRFIAEVLGADSDAIIAEMDGEIERIRGIGAGITQRRSVYFEVDAAPFMWSLGSGTFIHEMIELVGAVNIFAGESGWIPVTDEVLVALNPDVILTTVDFLDDPVGEIMGRPGWDVITAVREGAVFQIDSDAASRPSHNIVRALREIASAVYPEYFDSSNGGS